MSKQADDAPKVYVTRTGGFYVKAGKLLRSKKARQRLDEMADLAAKMKAAGKAKVRLAAAFPPTILLAPPLTTAGRPFTIWLAN